jgi:ABC-type Mn2+/Zn2+ transport system ATPase subunit
VLLSSGQSPSDRPLLEAIELGVAYRHHVAVRNVNLTLGAGEAVALVGRNGAGKSSLLRALSGVEPYTGRVLVHGVHCHHRKVIAPIAYVPQRSTARWDLPLTVGEIVVAGRRARGRRWGRPTVADRSATHDALRLLEIQDLADRPVGSLSGGQAQRVLLARAFAQEPQVLLLDEPFAGLDSESAHRLADAISNLCGSGMTVLCAMHELSIAREVFPRTVAIDRSIIGDGATTTILDAAGIERIFVPQSSGAARGAGG